MFKVDILMKQYYSQTMKSNVARAFQIVIILCVLLLAGNFASAQLPLLGQLKATQKTTDTSAVIVEIGIENVNREIEFTDNLLLKRNLTEFTKNKQSQLLQKVDSFNVYIERQGREFKEFSSNRLWRMYLVNARLSWKEYNDQLRIFQFEIQKMIRELQEQQNHYIVNLSKWEKSLPQLEKSLSPQIAGYIKNNQDKLNQTIQHYDERIKGLVSSENSIVQDIVYTESVLNDINDLIIKRRTELFKQNELNIFETEYVKSYSGSFASRMQLAFYENTKTFDFFLASIGKSITWFIFLVVVMVSYFLFIRKKYIGLNHDETNSGYLIINRIIVERPILTVTFIVMIMWTIFTPYSPLILNLFLYLTALVLLRLIITPVIDRIINKVILLVIVLTTLTNFEVFSWYFGNYSRLYLLLESLTGIALTLKYIYPLLKAKRFHVQQKQNLVYTRIIVLSVFGLNIIALFANVAGYENLAGYSNKLGIYAGFISIFAVGLQQILLAVIQAGIYVLNMYYPNVVSRYGVAIFNRSKFFLNVLIGYFWISGILHIAEFWESVSSIVTNIFFDKVKIGSLSFSFGKLILFIAVLYLTYALAKFTKRIFEREILAKHEMKRGVAASISLTIRIFVVFFGTLVALSLSGLDLSKIGIIAGALSVGIGFGLQNIVSNFISGLILIYEKPVQEGDTVEVDTLLGRVSNIGIRSSTITTYDGAEVVVPNSNLISNHLINWTLSDNRKRVEIKVGVSYKSDPHLVLKLLLKAALSHDRVLREPQPQPLFVGFGENSLNFRLLFWVRFEEGLATQSDVVLKIYDILKENNIEIPFPQLDLHVKSPKAEFLNDEEVNKDE